ncbi:RQC-minor-1 family DNA-binding protein [Paenibacillus arenilitoris]|uniref:Zinc-ribbon domain containing protein n=1 Tax=Paenibacillus arenilitoris TaxID=2772299 RepID=A0A927CKH1_9BACL|nr:RQC-minor-1 family DNA-binding protein [Paenibacillus arenilitoris]MBD2868827.1 zinc-ribbon domain containing protein [Paenibacillus arenilitoris]
MRKEKQEIQQEDLLLMLDAADEIVGRAGRSMLAKLLKGSRDKKLLTLGLDRAATYGCFKSLTLEQITDRVDWMIKNDYLAIQFDRDMPLLVFTERGWDIQREQTAEHLLQQWNAWVEAGVTDVDMSYLKERNRGMILLFLQKAADARDARFIPLLKRWEAVDVKKVKQAIREVVNALEQGSSVPIQVEGVPTSYYAAGPTMMEARGPERLKCWECGTRFEWSVEEQDSFRMRGWEPPKRCEPCRELRRRLRDRLMEE